MQVNSPASSRAAWYDRNSSTTYYVSNTGQVGPHALTSRFIYTVPTAKKNKAEISYFYIQRGAVATNTAGVSSLFFYAPNSTNDGHINRLDLTSNVVGDHLSEVQAMQLMMAENDQFYNQDVDGSTGGTCTYEATYKGTEFDA